MSLGTEYWSSTNIVDGLNALAICIEMIPFSAYMMWAYSWAEYRPSTTRQKQGGIGRLLLDTLNISDFGVEIWLSLRFFYDYARGKPYTSSKMHNRTDFGEAFGVEGHSSKSRPPPTRNSYDEDIRLAPYH